MPTSWVKFQQVFPHFEKRSIVWARRGTFKAQHDPQILDNGRLLIFDNKGGDRKRGLSRVLEYRLPEMALEWSYEGTPKEPFFTLTCGVAARLPNGNTLITETDNGRAFEVTPEKQIVWEFISRHRAGSDGTLVASLFSMERIPRVRVPWLKENGSP